MRGCAWCVSDATCELVITDPVTTARGKKLGATTKRKRYACSACAESFRGDPTVEILPMKKTKNGTNVLQLVGEPDEDETLVVDPMLISTTRGEHTLIHEVAKRLSITGIDNPPAEIVTVWITMRLDVAQKLALHDDAGPRDVAAAQPIDLRVMRALYRLIEDFLATKEN